MLLYKIPNLHSENEELYSSFYKARAHTLLTPLLWVQDRIYKEFLFLF